MQTTTNNTALATLLADRRKLGHGWLTKTVTVEGADIDVSYTLDGAFLPATETDPAEYPTCCIQALRIGGVDVTKLLGDSAIAERCAEIIERGEA